MLGRNERDQLELFITSSLRQLVPDDHILARVDAVLDLSWLHGEVADLYCADNGRPGIDPEAAVRLMLAGFLLGLVHGRRLMREAQVNLAIRWFVGYGLHEALPDHSSLTRIRQRWGPQRFRRIFERTVRACIEPSGMGRLLATAGSGYLSGYSFLPPLRSTALSASSPDFTKALAGPRRPERAIRRTLV